LLLLAGAVVLVSTRKEVQAKEGSITQQELVKRTQELLDAVSEGNQEPWKKFFADDAMYFDEKGNNMDKPALVKTITPLPKGYSGSIKVQNAQSRILGDTAILSYDMDESETVFGQQLKARYHATDTWMLRNGAWQIVAGQVLRYYEDPAPGKADPAKLAEYAGTYELAPGVTRVVSVDDGELYDQRIGRARQLLVPEAPPIFFRKGVEGRLLFRYGNDGKVEALIDRRNNEDIVWKKVG
jgi:hypothetical protein